MLVVVPSRGRPNNVRELIEAWLDTRTYATLQVVVDDDDETLEEYRSVLGEAPSWACLEVTPRKRLGPTLNEYAVMSAPLFDIIGFMGDDHRPRTPGWDQRFAAVIAQMGGTGIVYGNDLFQGPNLPTAVWMSARIVETLGYMVPPGIIHLFADDFWRDLGNGIGRLGYVHDVVIEHMHPQASKSEWDDVYVEVNSGAVWSADEATYRNYQATTLSSDIDKIRTGLLSA